MGTYPRLYDMALIRKMKGLKFAVRLGDERNTMEQEDFYLKEMKNGERE